MCAITLENKHKGTWGVWRHLLAFLGWQHRVALQHFHVEKHYLARESLLWVTLLPSKQWEVRTVTKLKTCFIKIGHCSTSWRGGKKRDSRETIGNENWTFERNNGWSLSSGTDILTKGVKVFSLMFLQGRNGKRALFVYSFVLEPHKHKEVTASAYPRLRFIPLGTLCSLVRSKPACGSAYFPLLSI